MIAVKPQPEISDESAKRYVADLLSGENIDEVKASELIDFLVVFSYGCTKYLERPVSLFSKALDLIIPELYRLGFDQKKIQQMINKATFKLRIEE